MDHGDIINNLKYVKESKGQTSMHSVPYSLRNPRILPPRTMINETVTDKQLDEALLLHCKASKNKLEELIKNFNSKTL